MNIALALSLSLFASAQAAALQPAQKPSELPRYWFGDPPREGTFAEWEQYYAQAALATLSAEEHTALEKLKPFGFVVPKPGAMPPGVKDGKRVVRPPPRGITLRYAPNTSLGGAKTPVPTPQDLEPLGELRHVEKLDLYGPRCVSDATLDLLRNMSELWDLRVASNGITDEGLKKLGRLKMLRRLSILGGDITDAGMTAFATFPALEDITLIDTGITDAGIAALAGNVKLQYLTVSDRIIGQAGVDGTGLASLAGLPALRALLLAKTHITDKGLTEAAASLAGLPSLRVLILSKTRVTDKGLAHLAKPGGFASLYSLDLSDTAVTDTWLQSLQDPKCLPALRSLDVSRARVTPEGVAALRKARPEIDIAARHPDNRPFENSK